MKKDVEQDDFAKPTDFLTVLTANTERLNKLLRKDEPTVPAVDLTPDVIHYAFLDRLDPEQEEAICGQLAKLLGTTSPEEAEKSPELYSFMNSIYLFLESKLSTMEEKSDEE